MEPTTSGFELPSFEWKKSYLKERDLRERSGERVHEDETSDDGGRGWRVRRDAFDGPPIPSCNCNASESGTFTGMQSINVILDSIPTCKYFLLLFIKEQQQNGCCCKKREKFYDNTRNQVQHIY